jgi:Flp pilus assembly pilin Flp
MSGKSFWGRTKEVQMFNVIKLFVFEETGQGVTEYALIILLVAMALMVTIVEFEGKLWALFNKIILAFPLV